MKLIEAILTYGKKIFIDKNFKNNNSLDMFLHKIYPKQIITRFDNKPFMFFGIKYRYTTVKGRDLIHQKYF